MKLTLDLRHYELSDIVNSLPFSGAMIKLKATTNFIISDKGATLPRMLSSEFETPLFRVNGARITLDWLKEAAGRVQQMADHRELSKLAMLGVVLSTGVDDAQPAEQRAVVEQGVLDFAAAFASLDDIARASDSPHVQLIYLMHRAQELTDPMFDATAQSQSVVVRQMSGLMRSILEQREIMKQQRREAQPSAADK
jgi:hypothetical protein